MDPREMDAEALEKHHTWPKGMTHASEWSYRIGRPLLDDLAYWMGRAGHQFSYTQVGEFETEYDVEYQVGTMTINGNETTYWLRHKCYSNGRMSVKGFGDFYSLNSDEFPTPNGGPITKESYAVAYEVMKEMEQRNRNHLARSDPRILYKHPDTGELLQWPEWKKAQDKHFEMISAPGVCRLPSFIVDSEMSRVQDALETSVTNVQDVEQLMKLSKEVEDAHDKWGRVEIQLTDGYPLCWVYKGTSGVDPADLLSLFEGAGMDFSVSES